MRRSLFAALPFVAVACSLTNLDGFTGGPPKGGLGDATPNTSTDASGTSDGTLPPGEEAGPTSTDPYGDAVRADAPTSWWRCEDTAGSLTLQDEMNQHHADVLARDGHPLAIEWGIPGAVGKGVQLGSTAGFFKIGDFFDFAGNAEFALEAWAQNDEPSSEYESIFNKRADVADGAGTGWIIYLHKPDRELGFQFWKDTVVTAGAGAPLPIGFHHVVLSATNHDDGVEYVLYVDGVSMDSDPKNTVQELDTQANLIVGFGWNGALDEMAIYEHPLTPERVLAHYNAARP